MAGDLESNVDKFSTNIDRVDRFTNGDENTTVEVDGGRRVPSLARAVHTLMGAVPVAGYTTETELLADLEPGPRAMAIAGDTERMFIKSGERDSGRWDPTSGALFGRLLNMARPMLVSHSAPFIIDRYAFLGGGDASEFRKAYFKQPLTLQWGDRKIIKEVLGPVSDDLPDHAEVSYDPATPSLIYVDLDSKTYKSTLLTDTGWTVNIDRVVPLAIIDGDNVTTALEFVDIYASDRVSAVPRAPIVFSAAEGKAYIPSFQCVRGSTYTPFNPPNGEFYAEIAVPQASQNQSTHYFDPASATIKLTSAPWPYVPGYGEIVIGRSWLNEFLSEWPVVSDTRGGFSVSALAGGRTPSQAPRVSAGAVSTPIVDIALKTLFAEGIRAQTLSPATSVWAGDIMPDHRPGQRAFARVHVEVDQDGLIGDANKLIPRLTLHETEGAFPVSISLFLEKRLSARSAIYSRSLIVPDNGSHRWHAYGVGAWLNNQPTVNLTIAGPQAAFDGRGAWIAHGDYPTDGTAEGRLSGLEGQVAKLRLAVADQPIDPLVPEDFWLIDGQPQEFYPDQTLTARGRGQSYITTLTARATGAAALPVSKTSKGESLTLDPARFSSAGQFGYGRIEIRRHSDAEIGSATPLRHWYKDVRWHAAPAALSGAATLAIIGDSLAYNNQASYTRNLVAATGLNLTLVGTAPDSSGGAAEARPGASLTDHTYFRTNLQPVPPGQEAAYLARPPAERRAWMPILRPQERGDDPATVFNGQVFDYRRYLNRFSLPDPDFVTVPLATNDIMAYADAALANIQAAFRVIVPSIRRALPTAEIGLGVPTPARRGGSLGDLKWTSGWAPVIRWLLAYVRSLRAAGDSRIWVLPYWTAVNAEANYELVTVSTDQDTGVVTAELQDYLHFGIPGQMQMAQVTAAWIACRKAGV